MMVVLPELFYYKLYVRDTDSYVGVYSLKWYSDNEHKPFLVINDKIGYNVDKHLLVKSTTIKDIAGMLVFPGDLVKIKHDNDFIDCLTDVLESGEVVFVPYSKEVPNEVYFSCKTKKCKIIGNKYQNADVLDKFKVKVFK